VATGADGLATVLKVIVDENGNVVSAVCSLDCHPMLKDAAEQAARTSTFHPLIKDGKAVRYSGTLHYSYVVSRVDWTRFGTALESTRVFDNISLGPVARILSADHAAEKEKLLSLDAEGVTYDTRQKVIREVENSVRAKLKGGELWRFELGMGLRRVTFWAHTGRLDRAAMQKAMGELAALVASAPENSSKGLIAALTEMSRYQITETIPNEDLQKAVNEMSMKIYRELR
jgi:hypothetical protein